MRTSILLLSLSIVVSLFLASEQAGLVYCLPTTAVDSSAARDVESISKRGFRDQTKAAGSAVGSAARGTGNAIKNSGSAIKSSFSNAGTAIKNRYALHKEHSHERYVNRMRKEASELHPDAHTRADFDVPGDAGHKVVPNTKYSAKELPLSNPGGRRILHGKLNDAPAQGPPMKVTKKHDPRYERLASWNRAVHAKKYGTA